MVVEKAPLPGSLLRSQKKNASSFFEELREELHCAPAVTSPDAPSGPEVPAAALSSSPTKKTRDRVEVVEFHSRHKKRKLKQAQDGSTKAKTSVLEKDVDVQEFNLEKARLEVHRFGITGYGKGTERVLEQERAIMLGAKVRGCCELLPSGRMQKGESQGHACQGRGSWEISAEL